MRTRVKILSAALLALPLTFGLLRAAGARDDAERAKPRVVSPEQFVSTDFQECDSAGPVAGNPAPASVDDSAFAEVLHGVWVGHRTVRNGRALEPELGYDREPPAHYVLIFDSRKGEAFAFEERGPAIPANAFARLVPRTTRGGPSIVYLYCGGGGVPEFRDEFVKVSGDPSAGLRALARVTGVSVPQRSISGAWHALREVDFYTRRRGGAHITAAYYTFTARNVPAGRGATPAFRWDMVGQYRGSPERFEEGQPVSGVEGGLFQGVTLAGGGLFAVAGDVDAHCGGPNALLGVAPEDDPRVSTAAALSDMVYHKVVVGPLVPGR